MMADNPCLLFSKNMVASRIRGNHNKPKAEKNDEGIIKMTGKIMEANKIKRLIKTIIHESNK